MRFIFESFILLIFLYYGYSFYSWMKTPAPYETTNLVRNFVGYQDSVGGTELAQYQGQLLLIGQLHFYNS